MKNSPYMLTLLLVIAFSAKAQIPNSGFENWPLSANGWPVGNPIQSTEVYPPGIGEYSLKLVNNAGGTDYSDFGFCNTFPFPGSWDPSFSISGHPNSLTGYFKFLPINGDTAVIGAVLYFNGDTVSSAILRVSSSVTEWTSFNIPFNAYETADSASVGFSAYNWVFGQSGMPTMQGNSELYVDNLNFDNLISTLTDLNQKKTHIRLYPNPASGFVSLTVDQSAVCDVRVSLYHSTGGLIFSGKLQTAHQLLDLNNLESGLYFIECTSAYWAEKQKLIIH